jgi:Zn-dependent peptidase ImmA (M78 family)
MERIHSLNPERILWCCQDREITLDDLAADTGISRGALERAVTREGALTFGQLRRVARYFGRGVLFFFDQEEAQAETVHTPQFRTLLNQKAALSPKIKIIIEQAERQRDIYMALRQEMTGDEVAFQPPDLTRDIARAAAATRNWLGLSDENDFGTFREAIQAKGILVFRSNGYNGKWQIPAESPILGFNLFDARCPVIVVRKERSEERQAFTLMHELAHILLHRSSSIDDATDFYAHEGHERDANQFAGLVLVPDAFLARIDDATRPLEASELKNWLYPWTRRWGVSAEVVLRRLMDAGRLARDEYAAYREWQAAQPVPAPDGQAVRTYRYREPTHLFGTAFVRTVLDSLISRKITLTRASTYLDGIKVSDVHKLEQHYASV